MDGEREVEIQTSEVKAQTGAAPSEKALASMEHAGHGGSMGRMEMRSGI